MSENVDQFLGVEPVRNANPEVAQKCPNCGKVNTGSGKFCLNCGANLAVMTTSTPQLAPRSPAAIPTPIAPAAIPIPSTSVQRVIVMDVNMTFGAMIVFMIKWAIAAIPALIVLGLIFTVAAALVSGVLGSLMYGLF